MDAFKEVRVSVRKAREDQAAVWGVPVERVRLASWSRAESGAFVWTFELVPANDEG